MAKRGRPAVEITLTDLELVDLPGFDSLNAAWTDAGGIDPWLRNLLPGDNDWHIELIAETGIRGDA